MQGQGLLAELINSFCCLPGVGVKSAQRMAFHLLQNNRVGAEQLGRLLLKACAEIQYCQFCRTLSETEHCEICSDASRDEGKLCVVESPADVWVIEQSAVYKGRYFVLHGRLSPLDGVGPDELGFPILENHFRSGKLNEIILATNSTVEGEATAQLIADIAKKQGLNASRIAHGVPMGGELEYIDSSTLSYAFKGRRQID